MEPALSITSLVICSAPGSVACPHSTPGNSVPASPIPEHVFMKFRRSTIFILSSVQPCERARKISHHRLNRFAAFFGPENAGGQSSTDGPRFFFPARNQMLYNSGMRKGVSMARFKRFFIFLPLVLLSFPLPHLHAVKADNPPAAGKEIVLKASDISPKIFPERVFFRGQSAQVQFRNSGGVHFADDLYVLPGMVASSPSSTLLKAKSQPYLLNHVTLEIAGQT